MPEGVAVRGSGEADATAGMMTAVQTNPNSVRGRGRGRGSSSSTTFLMGMFGLSLAILTPYGSSSSSRRSNLGRECG
ncbi:hypothetical protein RIF29_08324 [Crotalaria pallida]|uniref:Uncharacterized protein n=1 Tax=Crotalaria pallida TaxID=3830 RepID=A0AAN9FTD4_CROPI